MAPPAADIQKPETQKSPTPVKKRDRQRPFMPLNPRPADKKLDGLGVACGCVPPDAFGTDFEQLTREFLEQHAPAVVWIRRAIALVKLGAELLLLPTGVGALAVILFIDDALDVAEKKILLTLVKILLPRAARAIPQWVPVNSPPANATPDQLRARNRVAAQDQIVEVAGIVKRSYQNPIEAPFFQWHRWLNWSIHVKPDANFASILAPVNKGEANLPDAMDGSPIAEHGDIECQFDTGALWSDHMRWDQGNNEGKDNFLFFGRKRSGPMMEPDPQFARDWAWPMPGQFVWASGRWVYNCAQSTTNDQKGSMPAMLNPCKAIATARLVGFKFKENPLPVPATQFMFFICKRGGYIDFESINDRDYEFIVDLPELGFDQSEPFEIGRTNKIPPFSFDHNTIVIRPRLLKHVNTGAFTNATKRLNDLGNPVQIDPNANEHMPPIVELLKPEKPGQAPTQVKVTVRTSQLDSKLEAYGFILSLGWFDLAGAQVDKVRECTVTLKHVRSVLGTGNAPVRRDDGNDVIKPLLAAAREEAVDAMADVIVQRVPIIPRPVARKIAEVLWDDVITQLATAILGLVHSKEEWLFRIGVNGMWRSFSFEHYDPDNTGHDQHVQPFQFEPTFKFFSLPANGWSAGSPAEPLHVSMNGAEIDEVGEIMGQPRPSRRLHTDGIVPLGQEIRWETLVFPGNSDAEVLANRKKLVFEYMARILLAKLDDNDPLSFWEDHRRILEGTNSNVGEPRPFLAQVTTEQQILFESRTRQDYALEYTIDNKKIDPANFRTD